MKYRPLLAIPLAMLAGCNKQPQPQTQPPQFIQEQRQALDKAKGVGDLLDKQAEEQRKRAEEAAK